MIRPARSSDVQRLQEIERAANEAFRGLGMAAVADCDGVSLVELTSIIAAGRAWVTVGEDDRARAFVLVTVIDDSAHVDQVAVEPAYARHGLGAQLLDTAEGWARANAMPALTMTTFVDVPWNMPYYQRLGFCSQSCDELGPGELSIQEANAATFLGAWPRVTMSRLVTDGGQR